jgi:hypothetical protein
MVKLLLYIIDADIFQIYTKNTYAKNIHCNNFQESCQFFEPVIGQNRKNSDYYDSPCSIRGTPLLRIRGKIK